MSPPFPNSYWLEPGRILCGEYPRDFDDLGDHEGMAAILGAGVRVFLDLTGILHGEGAIPGDWIEALAKREELVDLAERFAGFCGGEVRA